MPTSRREKLEKIAWRADTHAGLWLNKYLYEQPEKNKQVKGTAHYVKLIEQTAAIVEPAVYQAFYQRWVDALASSGAQTRALRVAGRMIVGLGDESVLETAIRLHHTYGVPYIPGSALKGMAAAFVRGRLGPAWHAPGNAYRVVFGNNEDAGYVTFFDALYVPRSGHAGLPLHADVLTVHHPDYYQQGTKPPADWDSPTPVPFLSATGSYLLAVGGPDRWVAAAFDIMSLALAEAGIGAKTSSGYGRLGPEAAAGRQPAVEEGGARDATSEPRAAPAPVTPASLPEVGEVFKGEVVEAPQGGDVRVALPGFDRRKVIGIISHSQLGTSIYRVGNQAKVEVAGKEEKGGCLLLLLKPAKKK